MEPIGAPGVTPAGVRSLPMPTVLGVTALGVVGFGLHAGPVYRGAAAVTPTWAGIGSLALLLAGLLAMPARRAHGGQYRTIVAVLSVFGLLLVAMALIDRPAGAAIGWALIVIVVLAAAQTVLAVLIGLEAAPTDHTPARPAPREVPPTGAEFAGHSGMPWGTTDPHRQERGVAYGQAQQSAPVRQRLPAEQPQPPQPPRVEFTPPASPAATGAQPAGGSATPYGVWGHNPQPMTGRSEGAGTDRGQARQRRQPARSDRPM
ncbi:DUF5336 domain-containing protein [Mycolicibacterium goodii]|uniref:Uncharacterized protein n=1 Tax=Mycolicibacterium goodii TaxID=134601 RepID=A0A0K0X2G4_MYCGD|nr:hypothetical protein AFA91_06810 [Mycolicibacterium goodii]